MTDLYRKIQNYFRFDKEDSIVRIIIEGAVLLLSGVYLGVIVDSDSPKGSWWVIFLLSSGIYLYFLRSRLMKERSFPVTILEHLTASEELRDLRVRFNRKAKIDEYIERSIQSLNANTCPVVSEAPNNNLCHQDLNAGLRLVLNDFIEKPHYVLDIDKSRFTIGMYVKKVFSPDSPEGRIDSEDHLITFRDDLYLGDLIPSNLFELGQDNEDEYKLQTAIIQSVNFSKYQCQKLTIRGKEHMLICSPIPNVCEDCPADGAIFTIFEGTDCCPTDIENILLIFGRIISNWISKFNDCVRREKKIFSTTAHEDVVVQEPVLKTKIEPIIIPSNRNSENRKDERW